MYKQWRWQWGSNNTHESKADLAIPRRIRRPVWLQTPQARTLFGTWDKPSEKMDLDYHETSTAKKWIWIIMWQTQQRVMWWRNSLACRRSPPACMSVVPKHKDGMGKASIPCIEYRPLGYDPSENQMACGKPYNHMQRRCLRKTSVWLGRAAVTCFMVGTDPM